MSLTSVQRIFAIDEFGPRSRSGRPNLPQTSEPFGEGNRPLRSLLGRITANASPADRAPSAAPEA
jgi:hypothetical protein